VRKNFGSQSKEGEEGKLRKIKGERGKKGKLEKGDEGLGGDVFMAWKISYHEFVEGGPLT